MKVDGFAFAGDAWVFARYKTSGDNGGGTDDILWFNTSSQQPRYDQMDDASFAWADLGFAGADYKVAA